MEFHIFHAGFSPFGPDRCWSLFLECLIFPRDAFLPSPTSFPGREGPPLCASIAPLCASSYQMLTILRAAVMSESSSCPEPGTKQVFNKRSCYFSVAASHCPSNSPYKDLGLRAVCKAFKS